LPDAVEYRSARADEEPDILGLWAACLPVPAERLRHEYRLDPDRLRRTFVAVDAAGAVLSAVACAQRNLGDATGRSRLVGAVTCVATRKSARGRGHARHLLDLALAAMCEEGCAWSLLFTDVPGYYERLGWKTMATRYREGALAGERPRLASGYTVEPFDPTDPSGWAALAETYNRYNAKRPLCLARSPEYWRSWVAPRFTAPTARVLVARRKGVDAGTAGYVLAHVFDEAFVISEIAVDRPGEGAALALLGSLADRVAARGVGGGRAYLPFEDEIDQALGSVFAGLSVGYHHAMVTRPVAPDFDRAKIDTIFGGPGAIYWPSDDF
jgi:ribosomal protein S18 acetylase RimI-like enzyme